MSTFETLSLPELAASLTGNKFSFLDLEGILIGHRCGFMYVIFRASELADDELTFVLLAETLQSKQEAI